MNTRGKLSFLRDELKRKSFRDTPPITPAGKGRRGPKKSGRPKLISSSKKGGSSLNLKSAKATPWKKRTAPTGMSASKTDVKKVQFEVNSGTSSIKEFQGHIQGRINGWFKTVTPKRMSRSSASAPHLQKTDAISCSLPNSPDQPPPVKPPRRVSFNLADIARKERRTAQTSTCDDTKNERENEFNDPELKDSDSNESLMTLETTIIIHQNSADSESDSGSMIIHQTPHNDSENGESVGVDEVDTHNISPVQKDETTLEGEDISMGGQKGINTPQPSAQNSDCVACSAFTFIKRYFLFCE